MRRVGNLWDSIVSFENLRTAALRAARGKREAKSAARFLERLEPEIFLLQEELSSGVFTPRTPFEFTIHDPKERVISAAHFRDRVVHHALMDRLEPIFERRMIHESFACRKGKGTHAALRHARTLLRKYPWFLKLDIQKCFDSLDHGVVLEQVERIMKDRKVLDLLARIVRARAGGGVGGVGGVGLPIGNLTSQWLANLTLDRVDHYVKDSLRVPGYVRYMDDFVLFNNSKESLAAARDQIAEFVQFGLKLALKDRATILAPARSGLPFLRWRIHLGVTRLRSQNVRRVKQKLRRRVWQFETGQIEEERLAACVRSAMAHLDHGHTRGLRRTWIPWLSEIQQKGGGSQAPQTV